MKLFYILTIITILLLSGCNSKIDNQLKTTNVIADLQKFSQKPSTYANVNVIDKQYLNPIQKKYLQKYYSIWNNKTPPESLEKIMWPFSSYKAGTAYGENLKLLTQEWFDSMLIKSNFENYGSLNRYALTLNFSNLRNFPTEKPLFSDPKKAGEGYPFDYLQNSATHANEPLFVSHYSKNGEWVYVFTSYATGWLPSRSIVYLNNRELKEWRDREHIYFTKEFYPVKDKKGHFIFNSRVGMILPMLKEEKNFYVVRVSISDAFNTPHFIEAKIPKSYATLNPLLLKRDNLSLLSSEIMNSNYGWGGLNESRDCSSTIRDLFTPFGIWLPRNSSQQSKVGKIVLFKNLSNDEKIELIKKEGIAFETLLYLRGHIVLYIGQYKDNIMILHNMWGVKIFKDEIEKRIIIGKTVISTLEIGKEINGYNPKNSLLSKLKSMNILTK